MNQPLTFVVHDSDAKGTHHDAAGIRHAVHGVGERGVNGAGRLQRAWFAIHNLILWEARRRERVGRCEWVRDAGGGVLNAAPRSPLEDRRC